jgi:hypothetical protein
LTLLLASTPGKRFTMFLISRVCFTARSFQRLLLPSCQVIARKKK